MGRVGRVLSYSIEPRGDLDVGIVLVDIGGGENKNLDFYSSAGDDSPPMPGDFVSLLKQPGAGRFIATACIDKNNYYPANPGEKRLYARDTAAQLPTGELFLHNNGDISLNNSIGFINVNQNGNISITNGSATINLLSNGDVNINGLLIKSDGTLDLQGKNAVNSALPILNGDLANKLYVDTV